MLAYLFLLEIMFSLMTSFLDMMGYSIDVDVLVLAVVILYIMNTSTSLFIMSLCILFIISWAYAYILGDKDLDIYWYAHGTFGLYERIDIIMERGFCRTTCENRSTPRFALLCSLLVAYIQSLWDTNERQFGMVLVDELDVKVEALISEVNPLFYTMHFTPSVSI